jgi:D-alanyl-lipoteichoic acid acyltransferase DltB (MBOAT superfamily)
MVWKPIYILLIILSTLIDYYCSIQMGKIEVKSKRLPYITISIVSNLLILGTFKYFNFFNTAAYDLAELLNMEYAVPMFNVILPMGISFYTFQTMSYSIDVYRGDIKPETHFGKFALYVTLFPQLVAGPIERAKDLLSQFHFKYEYNHNRTISGLRLILWGLFKKVVIADQLSSMVRYVFDNPENANGFSVVFALILFTQQIYCDFSGYSDIAQGSARILGINLMDNFKFPLYAKSIDDLWRRWHISLVRWFTDYLYIPLGGSRKGVKRKYLNLFIIFVISGLWHGSNWTFILWSLFNGFFVLYSRFSAPFREKLVIMLHLNKTGATKLSKHISNKIKSTFR